MKEGDTLQGQAEKRASGEKLRRIRIRCGERRDVANAMNRSIEHFGKVEYTTEVA